MTTEFQNDAFADLNESDIDEKLNLHPRPDYHSETADVTFNEIKLMNAKDKKKLLVKHRFFKPRKEFGQPYSFTNRDIAEYYYFFQHHDPNYNSYINKKTIDIQLQGSKNIVQASTQVEWHKPVNKSTVTDVGKNYLKIEDENPELNQFVLRASELMEEALQSNEILDIFQDDFKKLKDDSVQDSNNTELSIIKVITNFEYDKYKLRSQSTLISNIRFLPREKDSDYKEILAESVIENFEFDERLVVRGRSYTNELLLWDMKEHSPALILSSPVEIATFEFRPKKPDILIAGAINGQVIVWQLDDRIKNKATKKEEKRDMRSRLKEKKDDTKPLNYHVMSALQEPFGIPPIIPVDIYSKKNCSSHRNSILNIQWLPKGVEIDTKRKPILLIPPEKCSVDHNQFMTVSMDGQMLFWDLRMIGSNRELTSWKAFLSIQLFRPDGSGPLTVSSLTSLNCLYHIYNLIQPEKHTTLYGASDDGEFFIADWNARPNEDSAKIDVVSKVYGSEKGGRPCINVDVFHHIMKDGSIMDTILTVYDFNFCIWKTDCDTPIFKSPYYSSSNNITCGCFSPTKPGIIFIGKRDGFLDVWDFLDQSYHPTQNYLVGAIGISSFRVEGDLLAVGDRDGCLHLLKLPTNLCKAKGNENDIMKEIWDREYERVQYVKKRQLIREQEYQKYLEDLEKRDEKKDNVAIVRIVKTDEGEKKMTEEEIIELHYQKFLTAWTNESLGIVPTEKEESKKA